MNEVDHGSPPWPAGLDVDDLLAWSVVIKLPDGPAASSMNNRGNGAMQKNMEIMSIMSHQGLLIVIGCQR